MLLKPAEGIDTVYRIGDLAHEFCVTLRTLRFYEDKGLISPKRNGTMRFYNNRDRARIKLILFNRKIGFSLNEIREILLESDKRGSARNPLASSKTRYQAKLTDLIAQKAEIEQTIVDLSAQLAAKDGPFAE
jgi:DNA-binding transcriptional MerR regulator